MELKTETKLEILALLGLATVAGTSLWMAAGARPAPLSAVSNRADLQAPKPAPKSIPHPSPHSPASLAPTSTSPGADAFADFKRYRAQVLPREQDKLELQRLLGDPARIEAARRRLLSSEGTLSPDVDASDAPASQARERAQFSRLDAVDFLARALSWRSNPAQAQLTASFEDVILEPLPELPPEQLKMLAGDKIELYWVLKQKDPDAAARLARRAQGTPLEKIIEFANRRNFKTKGNI